MHYYSSKSVRIIECYMAAHIQFPKKLHWPGSAALEMITGIGMKSYLQFYQLTDVKICILCSSAGT